MILHYRFPEEHFLFPAACSCIQNRKPSSGLLQEVPGFVCLFVVTSAPSGSPEKTGAGNRVSENLQ